MVVYFLITFFFFFNDCIKSTLLTLVGDSNLALNFSNTTVEKRLCISVLFVLVKKRVSMPLSFFLELYLIF